MEQILVVEDEPLIARDLEVSLGRMGYGVTGVAGSGEEALALVREAPPDLVLMDVVLRGEVDGVQAGRRIRAEWDIPVVYLTAYGDQASVERAMGTNPLGYLMKPVTEECLYATVRTALQCHRLERELRRDRGDSAAERDRRVRAAVDAERARFARDVHDHLGQVLVGLKFDLAWLAQRVPEGEPALGEKIGAMARSVTAALQGLRGLFSAQGHGPLDEWGLVGALVRQAREFQERTGIACRVIAGPGRLDVDRARARALYGVVRESLTNVARHAGAGRVTVSLRVRSGVLQAEVMDDGRGITAAEATDPAAVGLRGLRERVAPFGGTVAVAGGPGRGTTVRLVLPLDEAKGH